MKDCDEATDYIKTKFGQRIKKIQSRIEKAAKETMEEAKSMKIEVKLTMSITQDDIWCWMKSAIIAMMLLSVI